MAYTLQQLSDFEDIRTLKHRYYRAIDTADASLLASLFTENISVEYRGGGYRVQLQGRDAMVSFLMDSFHSDAVAMHQGHMPDITLTGPDSAEGLWYLEDIYISLERNDITTGSAIYRDRYVRQEEAWKMVHTEYDRIMEVVEPLRPGMRITSHYLAGAGRKPHERGDITKYIRWEQPA